MTPWLHCFRIWRYRTLLCPALLIGSVYIGCSGESAHDPGGIGGQSPGGQSQGGRSDVGGQSLGGQSQTGGSAGTTGSTTQDLGSPLLELPIRSGYDCSVTRDAELLGISPWSAGVATESSSGPLLLRAESTSFTDPRGNGATVVVSGIDAQGVRSEPTNVTEFVPGWIFGLATTALAGTTTAVWIQQELGTDKQSVWLAKLSDAGQVLAAPTQVGAITGSFGSPYLASAASGSLLLFDSYHLTEHTSMLTLLDDAGAPTGEPKVLLSGTAPAGLVRTNQGFLAAYSTPSNANQPVTYLVPLDGVGAPSGAAVPLGSTAADIEFIARGDEIWAAWQEVQGSYNDQTVAGTIRIGRFDANGNRLQADRQLQGPVEDYAATEPYWIDFGADVGLVWSKGGVTYICAGCMPNDHLEFVILDGTDLTPRSSLLTMTNRTSGGGLRESSVVKAGNDLLIISSATYHVSAEGASATIRCIPKT